MALFFYAAQVDSPFPPAPLPPRYWQYSPHVAQFTKATGTRVQKYQGRGAGDSTLAGLWDDCVLPVRVDGRQRGRPLVHLRFI